MTNARIHPATSGVVAVKREIYPNFDLIRLVAASAVIFSHAFLIGDGSEAREPFVQLLGPHNILGIFGVHCFFVISGFLTTQSLAEAGSVLPFLWRRFLRIYPALLVCLFLCAFLLGPLFSTEGALSFRTFTGVSYLFGNLLVPGRQPSMLGVSFYDAPNDWLGTMVNGSLWTIFCEVACYVLLAVIAAVGALRTWSLGLLALLLAVVGVAGLDIPSQRLSDFLLVAPGFFAGAALCLASIQTKRGPLVLLAAAVGFVLMMTIGWWLGTLSGAFAIGGAAPILLLATSTRVRLPRLDWLGDISYGTYLYGWPVEQVIRSAVGAQAGWFPVFAIALFGAYLLGYASWWLIEKPALRFKR